MAALKENSVPKLPTGDVVNALLSLYSTPRYLEIGVNKGKTFDAARASRKVAVDPRFRFDAVAAQAANPAAVYHQIPSDEYFGSIAKSDEAFDVILLDGLHTFEQTLRDLLNALAHLAPGGVILIDDVIPRSYAASVANERQSRALAAAIGTKQGWMGDVYRLVFFIETFCQQLTFRTVAENRGQLVVWRERRPSVPERRVAEIARMPYSQVILSRKRYRLAPLTEILELCREQLRSPIRPVSTSAQVKVRHPGEGRDSAES